jgi:hypothetical protein
MLFGTSSTRRQVSAIGLMLIVVTVAGVLAHTNMFSFLMIVCLGVPGLILLLDSLLA